MTPGMTILKKSHQSTLRCATWLMPERAHQDISLEHEEAMERSAAGVAAGARAQPAD